MLDLPVACAPTSATVYGDGNDGGDRIYRSGFAINFRASLSLPNKYDVP